MAFNPPSWSHLKLPPDERARYPLTDLAFDQLVFVYYDEWQFHYYALKTLIQFNPRSRPDERTKLKIESARQDFETSWANLQQLMTAADAGAKGTKLPRPVDVAIRNVVERAKESTKDVVKLAEQRLAQGDGDEGVERLGDGLVGMRLRERERERRPARSGDESFMRDLFHAVKLKR
ncbi:hypothetical protein K491DRAFT_722672 [Lophiostoma macrostomum CBS 122681]|uniref:Uncharacterized protein n=1 Tax=Lophiostoma macrostomum CBS 122681 TaxID=1314788 RepID=A0A6A6SQ75_9PLEO|nr:hypothetical protein K491DRAFT_722672 [Lophiostoma macrostomum CBS 122681]